MNSFNRLFRTLSHCRGSFIFITSMRIPSSETLKVLIYVNRYRRHMHKPAYYQIFKDKSLLNILTRCGYVTSFRNVIDWVISFFFRLLIIGFLFLWWTVPWAPGGSKFNRNPVPPEGVICLNIFLHHALVSAYARCLHYSHSMCQFTLGA